MGCEHMVLMVVLMAIKDRFASYCCETFIVPTTSQRGNGFIFCIAWFIIVRQTKKWREVHGGRWGVHALFIRGWLWSRYGALWWIVLCEGYCHNSFPRYRGGIEAHGDMMWGCVLWVQWYTSDQSLIYSNSRTRGYGWVEQCFSWLVSHYSLMVIMC